MLGHLLEQVHARLIPEFFRLPEYPKGENTRRNQVCYCLVQLRKILSIILSIIAFGGEYFVKVILKFAQVVFFVKGDVNYGEKSRNR